MSTYSTGTPPTDASKLGSLNEVFEGLRDNTSKLIAPKDVRNAVYTLWENIMFKPTSNSGGTEYIGIDQNFIQKKILIGKKEVGGVPVLNSNLLNSTDVDIFLFNTKTQSGSQNTTVAILAGTGSNFLSGQLVAPYMKSKVITNTPYSNTIDFELVNPSYYSIGATNYGGNVVVQSNNGNVVINGMYFPTLSQNTVGISQNDWILKYKYIGSTPFAVWEAPVTASITNLISAGTVSISGSPVVLNGLPINFTDLTPTPMTIGGIPMGSTFSNVPTTEMIRQILYPYINPEVSITLNNSLWEIGNDINAISQLKFTVGIYKNGTFSFTGTSPEFYNVQGNNTLVNYTPNTVPPTVILYGTSIPNLLSTYTFEAPFQSGFFYSSTQSYVQYDYSVTLTDTYPTTITSTASLLAVIPWYYGTATISATQTVGLNNILTILGTSSNPVPGKLTPLLAAPVLSSTSSYNKTVSLSTLGLGVSTSNDGYIYFGYPADFPDLVDIFDQNNFQVTGSFKKFLVTGVNSPLNYWAGRDYKFYIYVGSASGSSTPQPTQTGPSPLYSGDYKFNFG